MENGRIWSLSSWTSWPQLTRFNWNFDLGYHWQCNTNNNCAATLVQLSTSLLLPMLAWHTANNGSSSAAKQKSKQIFATFSQCERNMGRMLVCYTSVTMPRYWLPMKHQQQLCHSWEGPCPVGQAHLTPTSTVPQLGRPICSWAAHSQLGGPFAVGQTHLQ